MAIVGGGFSGTMLSAQLARRRIASLLIEKAGRAGEGTAYSTRDPAHLLNVPTGLMSAWADDDDDFDDWLRAKGLPIGAFAPRLRFGEYLRAILAEAVASGLVTVVEGEAVAAYPTSEGWTVALDDGRMLAAGDLALAIGNQPPAPLQVGQGSIAPTLLCDDPWSDAGRAQVARVATSHAPVVVIGTGLTMVDIVLTLAEAGHEGVVTALSRRGLDPRGYALLPAPVLDGGSAPGGLMSLWRWVRRQVAQGDDWRARIDSLRPRSTDLWQGFSDEEKRRFMRHARPWWDVHRHRIAPEVAELLETRKAIRKLEVMAGRIKAADGDYEAVTLTISARGGEMIERTAGLVVNCTAPLAAVARTRDRLLRQLLDDGLARADSLGIGIAADDRDAATARDGLWVMGPLTKARQWEIIAVPDIRDQAERVAGAIAKVRKVTQE